MNNGHKFNKPHEDKHNKLMKPTQINTSLAFRTDGFTSLVDALDYAAQGITGFNFYAHNGELETVIAASQD